MKNSLQEMSKLLSEEECTPQKYFTTLFEIRDSLHVTHLNQPKSSLAMHLALGEIYEGILPLLDGMIEGYTGVTDNKISSFVARGIVITDPVSYVTEKYEYLKMNSYIFKESWIRNEIDEICKILAIGMYKLKYVK